MGLFVYYISSNVMIYILSAYHVLIQYFNKNNNYRTDTKPEIYNKS